MDHETGAENDTGPETGAENGPDGDDDDPGTDFVIVEADPEDADARQDDALVAVPDADARYPGLMPVEWRTETGFEIVEESTTETGFHIVPDEQAAGVSDPDDGVAPEAAVELVPADADVELVLAPDADLVPVDEPPTDAITVGSDPFTPDLFRPNRGN
ncbi:hypothetical protein SAMN06269185_1695 [Natronoarchaeum philippinense]|uniref:Uncharacterized protein n=1 Tax=Natronoarchaeum philippinense TaxID=558529 RepID=A0A285NSH0_NATPI|nr:hypothetical protein [Natronoarchaeum philippinense]SNZ12399.1 hypothetical protein SAMN06269185_1695 [Natronoarchaeum philippinense]